MPADVDPDTKRYYQQLTRFSAALAFLADVSMGVLGGELKRKEKLSARLGDILSCLYLCSATLKRYEDEGRQAADAPLMHWAIWDAMFKAQNAFEGVISNFPNPAIAALLRAIVFPLGRPYVVPSDALGHDVAKLLIAPSPTRDRLTAGMFIPDEVDDPVRQIELALEATIAAEPIEAKLRDALRAGKLAPHDEPGADPERARSAGRRGGHHLGGRSPRARRASRAGRERDSRGRLRRRISARRCCERRVRDARRCGSACRRRYTALRPDSAHGTRYLEENDGHLTTDLHRRRRADAVPQGPEPAGAVRGVGPRDRRGARAAVAPDVRSDADRRGHPRLRGAFARRSQHRAASRRCAWVAARRSRRGPSCATARRACRRWTRR